MAAATPPAGALVLDEAAIRKDERYDGKYVLRTSTDWSPERIATAYKTLWMVERFFRDYKGLVDVRPVFHHQSDNVRGHIVGCFLSLYLAVALRKRLDRLGEEAQGIEWSPLIRDLQGVRAVNLQLAGRTYLVRSELHGAAHLAFRAAGMKPPPRVQPLPAPAPAQEAPNV